MEASSSFWDLPFFFSVFVLVYFAGYFIVFRNWSPETRSEASSCLISFLHGTSAAVLPPRAIVSDCGGVFFSGCNTPSQITVLDFSSAYFFADLLHLAASSAAGDALFAAHHVAVLFVFLTCRFLVGQGACGILALLALAEATSACQNTWALTAAAAVARGTDAPLAMRLRRRVEFPFYATYSVCRGVLGPVVVYKMTSFYVSGAADDVIPRWVWVSWIVVIVAAHSVSILWIRNLWIQFFNDRYPTSGKKTN
ncbi:PREDICTED: TLC domain-containing protein At5g14285 [Tarenaya hassleriana]|uniref:TLC domain-containing protein At5g14285 n=1 Tax=Tarenaya hassleriana TaxID=28532 RepID=UPI00053C30A0|nr:PREDICTED: TLC domain-containing protein At5g14285 [Tarenaya hassleriana]XP_010554096.1 PREDICTED: TLC domain-containing protein At5g14285 [Tarenaya hassleriana]